MSTGDGAGEKNGDIMKSTFFTIDSHAVAHDSAAVLVDALDMSILDANPRAAALLGRTVADLAGCPLPDLIESRRIEDGVAGGGLAPDCYRLTGVDGESVFSHAKNLRRYETGFTSAREMITPNSRGLCEPFAHG